MICIPKIDGDDLGFTIVEINTNRNNLNFFFFFFLRLKGEWGRELKVQQQIHKIGWTTQQEASN
jgi:hypothetical protein